MATKKATEVKSDQGKAGRDPDKSRCPDFHGVPGELIQADAMLGIVFGSRLRKSPYDELLDRLVEAGAGKAWLKFGHVRAKASVYARAKKKGIRVSFGEKDGALYVRLDGSHEEDLRTKRRKEILEILKVGPMTSLNVCGRLRSLGDESIDGSIAGLVLSQMVREGLIIRREDDTFILPVKAGKR